MVAQERYIYHAVPEKMEGTVLYPLNHLKHIFPELYEVYEERYLRSGREAVMKCRIDVLHCFWNDVLHCVAVDPQQIHDLHKEYGFTRMAGKEFFRIPVSMLDTTKMAVYWFHTKKMFDLHDEIELFSIDDFEKYMVINEKKTINLQAAKEKGFIPLTFAFIPHIFFKGSIETKNLDRVRIT